MASPRPAKYRQRGLHAGYRYQDLIAALAACKILMHGAGLLRIETGRFEGDPFDDLTLDLRAIVRLQVKHVENRDPLDADVFAGKNARLPIADLVAGRPGVGEEVRVVSTWTPPDPLPPWLVRSGRTSTFGTGSVFRLDAVAIWPDSEPEWDALCGVERADFLDFADRFVLELSLPPMSGALAAPGECEQELLRALREVGVERHPNNRAAVDVAGRLLEVAASVRNRRDRQLGYSDLTREIGLEVERGRVPQAYPLDDLRYVQPRLEPKDLADRVGASERTILVGEPGAGKSWLLEALARDLPRREWVVARHYCFLAPGDPDVQARVALEAMTGNLIYEVLQDAELADIPAGLGSDLDDLERVLQLAASALQSGSRRKICLVVDGLDHVARVETDPGQRRWSPTDFADALAQLPLPVDVQMLVGSQPGEHLDPLREAGATTVEVPPFKERQVGAQLKRLGVLDQLAHQGVEADFEALVRAVTEQAHGNPLYVTFLAQQVRDWISAGATDLPSQLVGRVNAPAGDLRAYYDYLLAGDEAGVAGMVVEHLGLIDFAVTEDELEELLPTVGRARLEAALRTLRPVLSQVASFGGYRVYHESLRRHVVARVVDQGRSVAPLLQSVINWLTGRGFYDDARAFRHLLPLLRRAGESRRLLDHLGPTYVGDSIVHLQPYAAVANNLRLGAFVAAELGDSPKLVAVSELRRAAHTSYQEKLSDITTYAQASAELFGVERVAQQLTYDDRAVYGIDTGLELCALVDRNGGTAPWNAYAKVERRARNASGLATQEASFRRAINRLRGQMRIRGRTETVQRVTRFLLDSARDPRSDYLDELAETLDQVLGPEAVEDVLEAADQADAERLLALRIRAAQQAKAQGDDERAADLANQAARERLFPDQMLALLALGVSAAELNRRLPDDDALAEGVLAEDYTADETAVELLLSAVEIRAAAGVDLGPLRARFAGAGWYRRWLRFVVDVATSSDSAGVVGALADVAADTAPFVGQPRASDLYAIRAQTKASFARALASVDDADMPTAVDAVLEVSRGTTTYLQRSPSGPLPLWSALEILLPHAKRIDLDAIANWVDREWKREYYELHAEAHLGLARLYVSADDKPTGETHWRRAGQYLAGYGMRKDVTLFAPLEALEVQPSEAAEAVILRLRRLRPLTDRALYHSDGKETRHLPGAWMEALAQVSPSLAADTLARTLRRETPTGYWIYDEALPVVTARVCDQVPAVLAHGLWRCSPTLNQIDERVASVERLAQDDPARGEEALAELAAAMDGDPEQPAGAVVPALEAAATKHGWNAPAASTVATRTARSEGSSSVPVSAGKEPDEGPFLATITGLVGLVAWARSFNIERYGAPVDQTRLAEELETKFVELELTDEQVVAVLESLSRRQLSLRRAEVIELIAEARVSSNPSAAADLFVIAWCAGRGGGGWERFGGIDQRDLLERARTCDAERALRRLMTEVAHVVDGDEYSLGMTRRVGEALVIFELPDLALSCVDAALDVIEYRLPATGGEHETWAEPSHEAFCPKTASVRLLASCLRHPDMDRRAAAVAGLAEVMRSDTDAAVVAGRWFMEADFTYVEVLTFWLLVQALGGSCADIVRAFEAELTAMARAVGLGGREVALSLLRAIGHPVNAPNPTVERTPVQASEIDRIAAWDPGDRLDLLAGAWHGVRRRTAERYAWLWAPSHRHICEAQVDLQFSRSSPWVPPKPQHYWTAEVFECALHDVLHEFRSRLVVSGRWPRGSEQQLLRLANPDVEGAAARGRSRIVRPDVLTLPTDTTSGTRSLPIVGEGRFGGWYVAGYWETELREAPSRNAGTSTRVYAGAAPVATPPLTSPGLPFVDARYLARWHDSAWPDEREITPGPLVQWWVQHDALTFDRGLKLTDPIMTRLGVRPAPLPVSTITRIPQV